MTTPSFKRTCVFISYSHKDTKFLDQLVEHLAYFERNNLLQVWSDKKITPGAQWREEIKQAIESTSVVVLLISPSFLASKFIAENELPPLLRTAEKEGTIILPIVVRSSYFEDTELAKFQALNNPSKPVASMKGYERDALWANVVREIRKAITPQQQSSTAIGNQQAERTAVEPVKKMNSSYTNDISNTQVGKMKLSQFIQYIRDQWGFTPKQAMDMLHVKTLNGMNYNDALEQLQYLTNEDKGEQYLKNEEKGEKMKLSQFIMCIRDQLGLSPKEAMDLLHVKTLRDMNYNDALEQLQYLTNDDLS